MLKKIVDVLGEEVMVKNPKTGEWVGVDTVAAIHALCGLVTPTPPKKETKRNKPVKGCDEFE